MTRKEKRAASRAKREAVVSKLSLDALTPGDWSVICASLIHERDRMFHDKGIAEEDRYDRETITTFEDKGWRINAVLVQLDHPAALAGPRYDVKCSKCGEKVTSASRRSVGGACPADKRRVRAKGSAGLHTWEPRR